MKNILKRLAVILLILAITGEGVYIDKTTVYAADSNVEIYIGNSKIAIYHTSLTPGEQTEEVSFELKAGTVKSSSYSSDNPKVFKIVNTTTGKCVVEALKEGTGLVTLTVKTAEGETYTQKLFISVYTNIENYLGITNKDTSVYMGATVNSGVDSYDNKGDVKNNTELKITATCEDFYLIKTLDGTTFKGGRDTGFIKKEDMYVFADSLKINQEDTSIAINNSIKLTTTIKPDIIDSKDVIWSSSNESVATVNANGQVSGKKEGTVSISAVTKGGTGKKDSVYISVYSTLKSASGYLNKDSELYKVANNKISRGKGKKGNTLTVVGQCGNYYRVKMDNASLYEDNNTDKYCYVLKTDISIPVQNIELNYSNLILQTGEKVQLKASISPETATNKKVTWKTSDNKLATVSDTGMVEAKKAGKVTITVETNDGKKDGKVYDFGRTANECRK